MNIKDKHSADDNLPILTVANAAKILCVHPRTLRIYDEQNLLVPQRSQYNRRLYSLDDIELGRLILFLTRNLALNLAGVRLMLATFEDLKIAPKDYIKKIEKISEIANITKSEQENNIKRLAKRGRRLTDETKTAK